MSPPLFPKPKRFRPSDLVTFAEFCDEPAFVRGAHETLTGSRRAGILYERRVHGYLKRQFNATGLSPVFYAPGKWIRFRTSDPRESTFRYAQPDGLLFDLPRSQITIIEAKLSHTQNAWWGLRRLYEPLIRFLFGPSWGYAVCEVTRYYDPAVRWPEKLNMVRDPSYLRRNEFGVMILSRDTLRQGNMPIAAFTSFMERPRG
jgi:hypothetical protein